MNSEIWRMRLAKLKKRRSLYPAPDPLSHDRWFWVAMGIVTTAVLVFCVYFIIYLLARQDAFGTNAEDLGIMDQALWNTLHGQLLHQTICNIVSDTNCYSPSGFTRFAIHFEPILLPVSLLYALWPGPKMLLVLQTIVVASGAYPAFWLARLRLRNEWAAVGIALLYLLYPAQQQATTFDFHALTFAAALLLFTLYFMYTRRTVWLFVFAILTMACKEEIPLVIAMLGVWSILFQFRWRSGLALTAVAIAWFVLGFMIIIPHASPTGHPLLISRYAGLDQGIGHFVWNTIRHPKGFLQQYIFEPNHRAYLDSLFSPAGFLPLPGSARLYLVFFAPWVLVLALPEIVVNLLSADPQMYSGLFQYNADIVPILIFTTIEAILVIVWLMRVAIAGGRRLAERLQPSGEYRLSFGWLSERVVSRGIILVLMVGILFSVVRSDYSFHGQMPFTQGFAWPAVSTHSAKAQQFIRMIPPDASVSAQTRLVPHLSERAKVYLFPYADDSADYIFLDVEGDIYPYFSSTQYAGEVKQVLFSNHYGVLAAKDGYLLLKRGLPAPGVSSASAVQPTVMGQPDNSMQPDTGRQPDPRINAIALPNLPDSFCSDIYTSSDQVKNPMQADFMDQDDGKVSMVGYDVQARSPFSVSNGYMTIVTYWRVANPMSTPLQILYTMMASDGKEYLATTDVPMLLWCQSTEWKPGAIVQMSTTVFNIQASNVPNGLANLSVALLPLVQSSSTIMDEQARLSLQVVHASGTVTAGQSTNALQLMPLVIVD